ncbi:SDR family NAD(P)-dependent oxidoreductase [Enterococcus raffinosus]|uniref:SDR family NAD(P)-dependent oxidoreductase n=2 Tax=Enterococcus TaxID=1350 RepID=A0AAP5KBV9_9ENTE|nr:MULTISPECIES: SDR family oxidoreductase [Enterococcus]SBA11207.1 short chain dehydrogenase/reductase family oxidoreductase [Enterococcus faecium]MDK7991246.1 SDR family oxidoreductase [Enterococcus raffinosus]MDT2524147.1 SDR family NAD(P)-dependent oxidoreductase [Enterococcus raffinosus]MDT2534872.1 SDR family NAD(P)-dependent oxidoreductase [Enterococcus raffinosus]MDT2536626.1 SDR family NAD(P)-dependent oxidoreductase [Enterococcus raffinosus]
MERMDGKVIVITGGSSGMGAAMAKDFVTRGAKVAIFDLNDEKGQNLIAETGEAAAYYKVDVTSKAEIEKGLTAVEEKFGPLTTLINSAGVSKMVPFLESSEALWDLTMNVNLKATFLCCQVAIERMLEHGGGEILNMSSLSGKKASSWQTVYCASKFGVQGLTQSIAKEFADQHIRVNSICPGIVYTEMWEKLKYDYARKRKIDPEGVMDYFKGNIPMHRLVDMQDVINAAVFLLTEKSSYLTGQSINLVGGEWMD